MSNLLKRGFTFVLEDDKRVIDTNELIAKKMESLIEEAEPKADEHGFKAGLEADELGVLFEDSDEAGQEVQEEAPVYTGPSPEEVLASAREEIEAMRQKADAEIEQERQRIWENAHTEGYQAGYSEGSQKATAEAEKARQEMNQWKKEQEAQYNALVEKLEPEFIETLTGIYEHIFHVDLSSYQNIITYLIGKTMGRIDGGRNFLIHVSKDDYPYVSMQKKQIMSEGVVGSANVEFVEDISLGAGECLIETDGGIYDCGLDTQLTELSQKLKLLSYEKK